MGNGWLLSAPSGELNQVMAISERQLKRLFRIMLNEVSGLGMSLPRDVGTELGQKMAGQLLADQLARFGLAISSRVVTGWLAEPLSSN